MIEILFAVVALPFFALVFTCLFYERFTKISVSPVMPWVRKRALDVLAEETEETRAYDIADLGCGWGGPLQKLSRDYPASSVTGFELSPWPFLVSKLRTVLDGRIEVLRSDFFTRDMSQYDIIFCYLSPHHMEDLKPQLRALKPGSLIVSCSFEIEGWPSIRDEIVRGPIDVPVYLYQIPARGTAAAQALHS